MNASNFRLKFLVGHRFFFSLANSISATSIVFALVSLRYSQSEIGIVLAARTIPMILALILGLSIADSFSWRTKMYFSLLTMNVYQISMAYLISSHFNQVGSILLLQMISGFGSAVYYPTFTTIVPEIAKNNLQIANSKLRLSFNLGNILGIAIAGVVVDRINAEVSIEFGAIFTVFSTLLALPILLSRSNNQIDSHHVKNLIEKNPSSFHETANFLKSNIWIPLTVLYAAVLNAANSGVLGVLAPILALKSIGAMGWSYFSISIAFGMICGAYTAGKFRIKRVISLPVTFTLIHGVVFINFIYMPSLPPLLTFGFLSGVSLEIFGVFWDTNLQSKVPKNILARVASLDALCSFSAMPIGQVLSGKFGDVIGTSKTVIFLSAAVFVSGIFVITNSHVRKFEISK